MVVFIPLARDAVLLVERLMNLPVIWQNWSSVWVLGLQVTVPLSHAFLLPSKNWRKFERRRIRYLSILKEGGSERLKCQA
jgi:hypothetical protein